MKSSSSKIIAALRISGNHHSKYIAADFLVISASLHWSAARFVSCGVCWQFVAGRRFTHEKVVRLHMLRVCSYRVRIHIDYSCLLIIYRNMYTVIGLAIVVCTEDLDSQYMYRFPNGEGIFRGNAANNLLLSPSMPLFVIFVRFDNIMDFTSIYH